MNFPVLFAELAMSPSHQAHSGSGVPTVVGLVAPSNGAAAAELSAAASKAPELPPAPKPGTSTSCTLLLQNMFQPTKERRWNGMVILIVINGD